MEMYYRMEQFAAAVTLAACGAAYYCPRLINNGENLF